MKLSLFVLVVSLLGLFNAQAETYTHTQPEINPAYRDFYTLAKGDQIVYKPVHDTVPLTPLTKQLLYVPGGPDLRLTPTDGKAAILHQYQSYSFTLIDIEEVTSERSDGKTEINIKYTFQSDSGRTYEWFFPKYFSIYDILNNDRDTEDSLGVVRDGKRLRKEAAPEYEIDVEHHFDVEPVSFDGGEDVPALPTSADI